MIITPSNEKKKCSDCGKEKLGLFFRTYKHRLPSGRIRTVQEPRCGDCRRGKKILQKRDPEYGFKNI